MSRDMVDTYRVERFERHQHSSRTEIAGEPSVHDFQVFELLRIVEIFATRFDDLPRFISEVEADQIGSRRRIGHVRAEQRTTPLR
jgi:hypothetical protein